MLLGFPLQVLTALPRRYAHWTHVSGLLPETKVKLRNHTIMLRKLYAATNNFL